MDGEGHVLSQVVEHEQLDNQQKGFEKEVQNNEHIVLAGEVRVGHHFDGVDHELDHWAQDADPKNSKRAIEDHIDVVQGGGAEDEVETHKEGLQTNIAKTDEVNKEFQAVGDVPLGHGSNVLGALDAEIHQNETNEEET